MKKYFLVISLIAVIIPSLFVIYKVGGFNNWEGVLPKGTTDSLYYYARMHEVIDGHPFIGNPYAYEHRESFSPAFFLPDIVSATPMLFGLPFNIGIIFNMFVWSFVFLILSFQLFNLLKMPKWWAFIFSVITFITSYSFMIRPTVMQLVYPAFLLFLIAFLKFLYEPLSRKRLFFLSIASALTFYVYNYLSYIVFLTLAMVFLWFLFKRRFQEVKALLKVAFFTTILIIPFVVYTLIQINGPYYFETFNRIGVVYTHLPAIEAFYYGRWVVIGLCITGLLWFFFSKKQESDLVNSLFFFSTGGGLLGCLFLNVITGVELTLAVHVGRFVFLWMVIIFGYVVYEWFVSRKSDINKKYLFLTSFFILILFIGVGRNIPRGLEFFKFDNRGVKVIDIQPLATPLQWLEENIKEESVVWANDSISQYIPIMTKHYPLFFQGIVLHSGSSKDIEDRYLLSRSFGNLTLEDIKRDFGLYSGGGPLKTQPLAYNQSVTFCEIVSYLDSNRECPSRTDPIKLRGEDYFREMESRFESIKKNQDPPLKKFNVEYVVIDRNNEKIVPATLQNTLYDDGRFLILALPF